ncbi:MAG: hypothetical protein ACLGIR_11700 [Actinomycetes bacterium]
MDCLISRELPVPVQAVVVLVLVLSSIFSTMRGASASTPPFSSGQGDMYVVQSQGLVTSIGRMYDFANALADQSLEGPGYEAFHGGIDALVSAFESGELPRALTVEERLAVEGSLPPLPEAEVHAQRTVVALPSTAVVLDVAVDATRTTGQLWTWDPVADAIEFTSMGSFEAASGLVTMTDSDGAQTQHTYATSSAATACDDICAEVRGGTAVAGAVYCSILALLPVVGWVGGLACGLVVIAFGEAAGQTCDSQKGHVLIGCEGTENGSVYVAPRCQIDRCTIEVVLRDRIKGLHERATSVSIWWATDGTFRNMSWTEHSRYLTRTNAGNVFDNAATYQATWAFVGSPAGFVGCTTAYEMFFTSRDAAGRTSYWGHSGFKPGTGEAACTY